MKNLIKQLKELKKDISERDIENVKNLIYDYIDSHEWEFRRIYYLLDAIKNDTEIEDLICEKVQNYGLFTLDWIKYLDFNAKYFQLDSCDNPINLEDWDLENRLQEIIDEFEDLQKQKYKFYDLAYNQ